MAFSGFTCVKSFSLHTLQEPIVWLSIVLFAINQMVERVWKIFIPYVHAYLDDLLCMPIILGLCTQIIQWIHPAKQYYHLSRNHIIISILFFSIVIELIYPFVYPESYTGDLFDVVCYTIGGLLFYQLVALKTRRRWKAFIRSQET